MSEMIGTCCCGGSICGGTCPCCGCTVLPCRWMLTLAGIGNGTCADCVHLNNTFTLTKEATCNWTSPTGGTLCGFPAHINLSCRGSYWALTVDANGTLAEYRLPVSEWNCTGPNTLVREFGHDVCSNWPATVTVTPILTDMLTCTTPCCGCSSFPSRWRLTITGVTNNTCGECNGYNLSILLFKQQGLCIWVGFDTEGFCGANSEYVLVCESTHWDLDLPGIVGLGSAFYRTLVANWNCLDMNVMPRFEVQSPHCNWPLTVTLVPA